MQVAEDFHCVLTRSLGNEARYLSAIAHRHDLLLIALQGIEHRAEIPGNLGDGESFHGGHTI